MLDDHVISVENLRFAWPKQAPVLDIERFAVERGETVFLSGPSGSGKSTLLGLIGGVTEPQGGRLTVLGEDMASLSAARRDALRASRMGVIFQLFNLVPYLSPLENVLLPVEFSGERAARIEARGTSPAQEARRLLKHLGLAGSLIERASTDLSVGQQQRVAAARALIGAPDLIIADEPTSALDAQMRDQFIQLLKEESTANGSALLFVSHDPALARHFDRVIELDLINRAGLEVKA